MIHTAEKSKFSLVMARPRINLDQITEQKATSLLLDLVTKRPNPTRPIGNGTLLGEFLEASKKKLNEMFGEEVYWNIRNQLIDDGKLERGRGKGGSVRLAHEIQAPPPIVANPYNLEKKLYDPFHQTIQKSWVQEYDVGEFVSEITAHKGRKDTGGKWTRPDIILVTIGNYEFIPGKALELVTFEIKTATGYGIESVYETASHSAYANKSYLAIHSPDGQMLDVYERMENECVRFGVGVITFEDPKKWDTFEVRIEARHNTPSPRDMNEFITLILTEENRKKLLKDLK